MRILVEAVATALLLCTIVGSGIMAQTLTSSVAIQLMMNAFATIAVLYVLINLCSGLSGAHFNPVVTLINLLQRKMGVKLALGYIGAQILGAISGTALAHLLFAREVLEVSNFDRQGANLFISEVIATFGLVTLATAQWIDGAAKNRATLISLWIGGAYFFTSSTAFANPAVTIGRIFTESFAGISPQSVIAFLGAQVLGALLAFRLISSISSRRLEHQK